MKKFLSFFLVAILLFLSACNDHAPNDADTAKESTGAESTFTDVSESGTTENASETSTIKNDQLPLPGESAEFSFLSGAGAWRTIITLNRDGTFTGWYLDSEMGETGEGYPMGSAYVCDFSGRFENIKKVDEYSYQMTLTGIKTEKPVGEEWIEDGIRYVASEPHGLNDPDNNQECVEFIFYLPDTPVDQVPEAFLDWWPYRYTQETEPKGTLSCYGILNVTTGFGFFTTE